MILSKLGHLKLPSKLELVASRQLGANNNFNVMNATKLQRKESYK